MPRSARYFFIIALLSVLILIVVSFGCEADDDDDDDDDDDNDDNSDDDDDFAEVPYAIVDTDQSSCYDDASDIGCPASGDFFGQDAQYDGRSPSYTVNGDGTVTDNRSGLMWQQDPGGKMSYAQAVSGADSFELAGYSDWRLPTIKELYSLIQFSGEDPSGETGDDTSGLTPFIDDGVFGFEYGDPNTARIIDSQWTTSNVYASTVFGGEECFFGVNFADGRIKCYPTGNSPSGYFTIYVRNTGSYAQNDLQDNGDGSVTDRATGLIWQQDDSGSGMIWKDALDSCESMDLAGRTDWRLPNAKELQSIVDYSRSPDTTGSPAIDPLLSCSTIANEAGQVDYASYWTGTTHASSNGSGGFAVYVSFGRALGYMDGWIDVHGAGAQRSDPKVGDPADYPEGHGPQGDAIRIYNYVRCVTAGDANPDSDGGDDDDDDDLQPPPQEAVEACEGKQVGDDCSFQAPDGLIEGTCLMVGEILACVP